LRYVDEQAAILGFAGWYADINSKLGRRSASLERLGGQIIQRSYNRTLSWLAGESIERLRVVRQAALTEMKSAA
jgi:ATP-dependent protease HslVU (ClpYQ) peptidase subunit